MSKISTKEEVILAYLKGETHLDAELHKQRVERSDETRQAIIEIGDPETAYFYARYIDKKPRSDTRTVACKQVEAAFYYAIHIDKCHTEETWQAVKEDDYFKKSYMRYFEGTYHRLGD